MHEQSNGVSEKKAQTDHSIGRIVSVAGAKAIVMLDKPASTGLPDGRPEMGTLLAIETSRSIALAIVSALSIPVPAQRDNETEFWVAELGLVGELSVPAGSSRLEFSRGASCYPALGDRVRPASRAELKAAFSAHENTGVRVGTLRQDDSIAVHLNVDDLLGKHFAVVGSTGTGKSCTTALILRAILERNKAAHMVLIDPHNEYQTAFKEMAEVISPSTLQLPLWLMNFEETIEIFVPDPSRKAEIEILGDLIPIAKARFASGRANDTRIRRANGEGNRPCLVDSPVPYRISDLLALIDERMGRLENKRELAPYRQLRQRIETISLDSRYGFLCNSLTVSDDMAQVLGRLFRVPLRGKPLTILQLSGIPSEIVNVVVAVLCRLTFEFVQWSDGEIPITLVCEEAHRYVPANGELGFAPCKRAIAKIAKEGRKYGASLCIISQRPAEIDPTILSQCNTVFALRLSNDRDQDIVSSAISDTSLGLLEFLPALGQREALSFGEGIPLPVRILFDELPPEALPKSSTAKFTERWQNPEFDAAFLDNVVDRWRRSTMSDEGLSTSPEPVTEPAPTPAVPLETAPAANPEPEWSSPEPANAVDELPPVAMPPPAYPGTRTTAPARAASITHATLRERLTRSGAFSAK